VKIASLSENGERVIGPVHYQIGCHGPLGSLLGLCLHVIERTIRRDRECVVAPLTSLDFIYANFSVWSSESNMRHLSEMSFGLNLADSIYFEIFVHSHLFDHTEFVMNLLNDYESLACFVSLSWKYGIRIVTKIYHRVL